MPQTPAWAQGLDSKSPDWSKGLETKPSTSPTLPSAPKPQNDPELSDRVLEFIKNSPQAQMLIGAGKGAGHTFETLGKLWHLIPGFSEAVDKMRGTPGLSKAAFAEADRLTKPEGFFQHAGYLTEQVGETVVPGGVVSKTGATVAAKVAPKLAPVMGQTAAKVIPRAAVEGAGSAAIAAGQGGDPTTAAVLGAGVNAAIPVAGAVAEKFAPGLKESAVKQVSQALGATKERYKAIAERIAPEILKRGLKGNQKQLHELAEATVEDVGPKIDQAIQQFGARQVGTDRVIDALESSKDAFRTIERMSIDEAIAKGFAVRRPPKTVNTGVLDAAGRAVTRSEDGGLQFAKGVKALPGGSVEKIVEFEPRAIRQLNELQDIVRQLGSEARVDQLVALRRSWDKVVAQAGGFAHRAPGAIGLPLRDASEAAAKREATNAIRGLLNEEVPELTKINKEFSFWKSLEDVLSQTLKRTQPQGPGLISSVNEAGGRMVGAAMGDGVGTAIAAGKLAKLADAAFRSPRWRLFSARQKDALAEAIVSGKWAEVAAQLGRVTATQGAKVETMTPARAGGS